MGAVEIHGFNATTYKCIDIWVKIDLIPDVQHSLLDFDPATVAELKASFRQLGIDDSCGLSSVTAVQPAVEPLDPHVLLDFNKERRFVLNDDCHVKNRGQASKRLTISPSVPHVDLYSIFDQIPVIYITGEDKKLLLARKTIMLSLDNNSLSAMFRSDTRCIYLFHCDMNYSMTFDLEYDAQFLLAQNV